MKLNKNEQNYLLTILFKSYILQSVICSGIILVCTVSLDMGLTWVLDRYVEHYYLIYRGLYVYMVGLILWVVCIMYLTYKLLKKVVNYVYELQTATGKLFDKSVDYIELSPELSEIAININRLKQEAENNARLAQENEQRKNDLIMYLAHDLKTPLSSVIGYLTLLHDDEQQISQELREKYLSITLDKAERLEDLINEFFEITRFNLSNITLQYSNINLTRLLEQLIYEFKPILKEKNLKCTLNSTSDIMLHCDANKIQRVFDNLLRNAVIYSYTDTEVAITTELQENTIVITFENFGNPIAEEKLKLIFEQFYRVDTSRNTTSGGAGLGLAIAKHICSSAGNKITEGGVIGKVSEEEIKSPVDATILSIISSNESVPKNYPLATAKYTGFALNIEAENFLKILPENAALKAKFQVVDGVGPTEAIAVVVPVSENAESTLQCLIGKDIDVKPGQSATVVITAETRKDVLLLPLSVIAGRQGKGMVTVINDGKQIQTEVMLGATDGAYIEILSGVNEGDTISSIPPNLDPRSNL